MQSRLVRPTGSPKLRTSSISARKNGFTVLELLIVIAVIGVLLAVAVPSVRTITAGSDVRQSTGMVFSTLSLARQTAASQNAHVFVAFHHANDGSRLSMIMFRTRDGSDPFEAVDQINLDQNPADIMMLSRPMQASNFFLRDAGFQYPQAVSRPAGALSIQTQIGRQVTYQGKHFDRIVQFGPTGEIYVDGQPKPLVEFGIQTARNGNPADRFAIFQIPGTTGQAFIYQN